MGLLAMERRKKGSCFSEWEVGGVEKDVGIPWPPDRLVLAFGEPYRACVNTPYMKVREVGKVEGRNDDDGTRFLDIGHEL